MALFEYKEGQHPGGFVGLRVVCTVGKDYRQKYFSFRKANGTEQAKLKIEATALEAKWAKEAAKVRKENRFNGDHPNVSALHATGFTGLRLVILCEKKQRLDGIKKYYAPAFVARGSGGEKSFRIGKHGYEKAWSEAVKHLSSNNDLPRGLKSKMIDAIPERDRFKKVRVAMNKKDHEIPMEVIKKIA